MNFGGYHSYSSLGSRPETHHFDGARFLRNFSGIGPRNYRRSDERVHEAVHACLRDAADVDAENIEVAVRDGLVRLAGSVPSRWMRQRAEDRVADCVGVVGVENGIAVERGAR